MVLLVKIGKLGGRMQALEGFSEKHGQGLWRGAACRVACGLSSQARLAGLRVSPGGCAETAMHLGFFPLLIQVFDVQRKITYRNLSTWYAELREFRPEIPCIVVANKIDGEATPTPGCQQFVGEPTVTRFVVLSWAIKPPVICSSQNRSLDCLPSLPFQ